MSPLAWNLLLAVVWMFVRASFSLHDLVVGFVIGAIAIAVAERLRGSNDRVLEAIGIVRLAAFFAVDLVRSNLILARDILRPTPSFSPALVRCEVHDLSPAATALLGNMISLTPGTLTVDIEDDGSAIYVHSLYADDPAVARLRIERLGDMIRRAGGRRHATEEMK